MSRLVFLGPPGVGKGTQAAGLAQDLGIPHISTGAILRDALERETPTGLEAKKFMDAGELVPDSVVLQLVRDRLAEEDARSGWLLDGYPRNLQQGEALQSLLQEIGDSLDHVIYFECAESELVRRLSGRRTCKTCGSTFHIEFAPVPEQGQCDAGGECEIYQRSDDVEEAILNRLEVYHRETGPLVDHYRSKDQLVVLDGAAPIDEVGVALRSALN
ncbi:MAG: adenylate kinase [Planctomycetia bacterium TMED53]|nr:MAG: adenylate kinase [Planctomycetia bacterium TMED53]